jgi:hypothetical protein
MAAPLIVIDPQPRSIEETFEPKIWAALKALGEIAVHDGPGRMPAEQFEAYLPEMTLLIGQSDMPKSRLDRAPKLRAIINVETNAQSPNTGSIRLSQAGHQIFVRVESASARHSGVRIQSFQAAPIDPAGYSFAVDAVSFVSGRGSGRPSRMARHCSMSSHAGLAVWL